MKKTVVIALIGLVIIMTACSSSTSPDDNDDHFLAIELPGNFIFPVNETYTEDFSLYIEYNEIESLLLTNTENTQIEISITGLLVEMNAPEDWTGTEKVTFTVCGDSSEVSDVVLISVIDPSTPTISLESATISGGDFDIALNTSLIDSAFSACSFEFTITYDADYLAYNSITLENTLVENYMHVVNDTEDGIVIFALASAEAFTGEGPLVFFNFTPNNQGETFINIDEFKYNSISINNLIGSIIEIQ